ncbi:MAG: DUF4251 domain-containing protein [Aquaticitalea sp.]
MKYVIGIIMIVLLVSCNSTKSYTEQENREFESLKELVTAKNLEIESNTAKPMASTGLWQVANSNMLGPGNTVSSIDISGNSNHLTIKGDSIKGFFPYFGEVHCSSVYPGSTHQGIQFNEIPKKYQTVINANKRSVDINFEINDQYRSNEQYDVTITLFPNLKSTVQIRSSNRSFIEYVGTVSPLKEDDKSK